VSETDNGYILTYSGAKVHRQGKGFLCFNLITKYQTNQRSQIQTTSAYNPTYFYPKVTLVDKLFYDSSILQRAVQDPNLITTTANTWSEVILDATNKRIYPYIQTSTVNDIPTGYSITTTTSSLDNYGNTGQIIKTNSSGGSNTIAATYTNTINSTDWKPGILSSVTTTDAKAGETSVSHTINYTYSTDGILKPDIITYNPGTTLAYTLNHDYDSKGNLTQVFTSGASIGTSQVSLTYDTEGARVLTSTDPPGHITTNTYDTSGRLLTQKDFLNNTITFGYDNMSRQSSVSSSIGSQSSTNYVWTGTNKPTTAVYGITQSGNDGSVSTIWYNIHGDVVRTEKKGFGGNMILTDTEYGFGTRYVSKVSDPYFAGGAQVWAENYTYDIIWRVTNIDRNTGRNTTYAYDGATTTETTAGKISSKTFAADGTLSTATDNGGTITYAYYADGKPKNITATGGVVTSVQYADAARNQTQLIDPSAGTINYTYDALGRIKTQTNARNQLSTFTYLADGRTDNVVSAEGTTTYTYNTNKQLTGISSPGSTSRTYGYDTNGRVTSVSESIAGSSFPTSFTYDSYGRLSTRTHPSGIVETLGYNGNGYMATISAGGSTRYTVTGMNARQQLTGSTYGSTTPVTATFGFDAYGYPLSQDAKAGTVYKQDYRYVFSPITGNLTSRQNYLQSKSESFTYDTTLDRLLTVTGPQNLTMSYNANGNINTRSNIGTVAFSYGASSGPYALTGVTSSTSVIPTTSQAATYTSFEKVSTLTEGAYSATFLYNADKQRAKMDVTQSGTNILTRWYAGASYMKETVSGISKEYTYLGGDAYTAPVAASTQNGVTTYYYLLRDYLGNITHVVNSLTTNVTEYSYDAWGRRRNPTDWSYTLTGQPSLFADRGFTSHEFLSWFNLYNMNGRMYDPLVGRFLSADNYVQDPTSSQSYNRYSYGLNNPLKYSDPSGWLFHKAEEYDPIAAADAQFASEWSGFILGGSRGGGGVLPGWANGVYHYDSITGEYTNDVGDIVPFNEINNKYVVPRLDQATKTSYAIFQSGGKDGNGKFVGNGIFGIIKEGIMVSDGTYSTFTSYESASNYINSVYTGQWSLTGLPENNFIKYSISGILVWANTIQSGFNEARKIQPLVSTWIRGANVFGKTSNFLGGISIMYDFATGTANSSTVANGLFMAGGATVLFFGGVALVPWVAGAGAVYGIISVAGGDAWLNRNIDISGYLNFVKPSKP